MAKIKSNKNCTISALLVQPLWKIVQYFHLRNKNGDALLGIYLREINPCTLC